MRTIRKFAGALVVAGMASWGYAATPTSAVEPTTNPAISSAVQQDQTAPPKQDEKQDQAKPQNDKDKDARAPKSDKQQDQMAPKQQTDRDRRQDNKQQMQGQKDRDQRAGGGTHGKISDNDYRAHFGRQHSFTVRTVVTTTRIVPNQTRFVYGGYNFVFVEAWPAGWALTDDCYVDYIDGEYVLIDLAHPGMQITLEIVG